MKYATKKKTVIDFGAGIGTLSLIFRDKFNIQPLCLEIDKANKEYLEKKGFSITYQKKLKFFLRKGGGVNLKKFS